MGYEFAVAFFPGLDGVFSATVLGRRRFGIWWHLVVVLVMRGVAESRVAEGTRLQWSPKG